MARFEHSRERKDKRGPKGSSPRGRGGGSFKDRPERDDRRSFRDRPKRDDRRPSGRESNYGRRDSNSRGRREFEMTKVTCDSCGNECEVPFKPTSDKPVYCSDCFKKNKPSNSSNSGLDMINEKLNKIMKALKIE